MLINIDYYVNELIIFSYMEMRGRVKTIRNRNVTMISVKCIIERLCTCNIMQNCTENKFSKTCH